MSRTETFFLSALSTLVVFTLITSSTDWVYGFLCRLAPAMAAAYPVPIKITTTVLIICALTLVVLMLDRLIQDKSPYKYSEVIASVNRKSSVLARDIVITTTRRAYWERQLSELLKQLHDAFLNNRSTQISGTTFSVSIMKPHGGVLKTKYYFSDDELFEPNYTEETFQDGQGFCGWAWRDNFPQSGRKRRRIMRDIRYANNMDTNSRAKSFFCTPVCSKRKNKQDRYILVIASDKSGDFLWYERHALSLHYGLQAYISLVEFCMEKLEP
jgi:hypothetical protein